MKTTESKGFFCVVYFSDTKKTCYYHKVWKPKNLAHKLENWLWIKCFVDKNDYYSNRKAENYFKILRNNSLIEDFTFQPFTKKV